MSEGVEVPAAEEVEDNPTDETINSPRTSIKSGQELENVDTRQPEKVSLTDDATPGEQNIENTEGQESSAQEPAVQESGAQDSTAQEVAVQEQEPPTSNQLINQETTSSQAISNPETGEDNIATQESMESPELDQPIRKLSLVRRVSFQQDVTDGRRRVSRQDESGLSFISNKGVVQPSLNDLVDDNMDSLKSDLVGRARNRPPRADYRAQPWLYAVFGILLLTVLMRFSMSTFGFIFVVIYSALVALLALRYVGHGPFAKRRRS